MIATVPGTGRPRRRRVAMIATLSHRASKVIGITR